MPSRPTTYLNTLAHKLGLLVPLVIIGILTATLIAAPPARAADSGHVVRPALVIAAGDSTVQGVGAHMGQSWPERLEGLCAGTCRVKNVGHGGSCLVAAGCLDPTSLTESFDREVLALHPDVVIIGSGRNDLCHLDTKSLIAGYRALLARGRAAGVEVRFATITPAGEAWPWPCEVQRLEVNGWLRTRGGTIDFERPATTPHGVLRGRFDSGDGLHMNARGYWAMARIAARALRN